MDQFQPEQLHFEVYDEILWGEFMGFYQGIFSVFTFMNMEFFQVFCHF